MVAAGRVRTAQALVRKTGETKGRSGGLKIRLKSARSYRGREKSRCTREGAQGWWMLKGKLKGANAATERTRTLFLFPFFFTPSPARRHPLRLISEIDRLLACWNRLERALYRQPPVLLADAWHVGAVTSLWRPRSKLQSRIWGTFSKVLMVVVLSYTLLFVLLRIFFILSFVNII